MNTELKSHIETIVASPSLHALWLNSLSYMENCGARKISRGEHPEKVTLMILKHAAEEARHAYYLKNLITRLDTDLPGDYSASNLLAPQQTRFYLHALDIAASRYLRTHFEMKGETLKMGAYLLVTYAIEVRADELYSTYQEVLTAHQSRVNVKSIIAEEEGHLQEMTDMLQAFHPAWQEMANEAIAMENSLFQNWLAEIGKAVEERTLDYKLQ